MKKIIVFVIIMTLLGTNPRPLSCIMNDTSGSNLSVSGFLCDGCQTDLYAHLNSHHAVE